MNETDRVFLKMVAEDDNIELMRKLDAHYAPVLRVVDDRATAEAIWNLTVQTRTPAISEEDWAATLNEGPPDGE